jgi:hypothetical protein
MPSCIFGTAPDLSDQHRAPPQLYHVKLLSTKISLWKLPKTRATMTTAPGVTPRRERIATGRGAGFGADELRALLEVLEEHLPIGRDEWELVLTIHNLHFGEFNRTVDSIRRKFAALCRSRIPTGNPTCPAEVRTAKRVRYLMTQRAEIGEGDHIPDEELGLEASAAEQLTERRVIGDAEAVTATGDNYTTAAQDVEPPTTPLRPIPRQPVRSSPRPLVGRNQAHFEASDDGIAVLVRLQLPQSQEDERVQRETVLARREDERQRWEAERLGWEAELRRREDERREDRVRREESDRRHEQLMQLMVTMMAAFTKHQEGGSNSID